MKARGLWLPHCLGQYIRFSGRVSRDADFPLFSVFSVMFGPIRSPPIRFPFSVILYFLLFHLSLSELSVSFCVHFL